jgi:hypothetical protein
MFILELNPGINKPFGGSFEFIENTGVAEESFPEACLSSLRRSEVLVAC